LPADSLAKLQSSGVFKSISGTDSHPSSQQLDSAGSVVSIAGLLMSALSRT
jgi:ribose-phosphate pyrophosphokinase